MWKKFWDSLTPITQKRLRVFWQQSRSRTGVYMLLVVVAISLCAEILSNENPIFLMRDTPVLDASGQETGQIVRRAFFPMFKNYSVDEFGITDSLNVNYKEIEKADKEAQKNSLFVWALVPFGPTELDRDHVLESPSRLHWLGTDNIGRDVLSRTIYGIRSSLLFGFVCWFFSYTIGTVLGAFQGYFGGSIDFAFERIREFFDAFPRLPFLILLFAMFKTQSILLLGGLTILLGWTGAALQMRVQVLSVRRREFCEAALAMGGGHRHIVFKHIIPNALTPVITSTPFVISGLIDYVASLEILGFGFPPPQSSLGETLNQGIAQIPSSVHLVIVPSVTLVFIMIAINRIGLGLRTAFDPRS